MDGGAGNDLFLVDDPGGMVVEAPGGGWDGVQANIAGSGCSLRADAEIERIELQGTTRFVVADDFATWIAGNASDNPVIAGGGNDTVHAGGGRDTIQGSGGDRLEIASAATSAAIEPADGIPFIFRGFDATGAEVERIEITGAALFDSLLIDAPLATGGPGAGAGGGLGLASPGAGIGAGALGGVDPRARAGGRPRLPRRLGHRRGIAGERAGGRVGRAPASLGRGQAARGTLDEPCARPVLEPRQPARHRRRREAKPAAGRRQAAAMEDGQQQAQLVEPVHSCVRVNDPL